MPGRAIALSLLLTVAGCGVDGSRPPPLLQEQTCPYDGSCIKPLPTSRDAGTGCPFGVGLGEPREGPAEGKVVELADPTFPMRNSPRLIYYGSTPLNGIATVEIERDSCTLVSGVTKLDGNFSLEGTSLGDVSVRIRPPPDRPDLITTIHHYWDDPLMAYPILTRDALASFFEGVYPGGTPDPKRGHIIVTFVLAFNAAPLAGGKFSAGGFGEIVYDGTEQSGDLGLGASLNTMTKPYPGENTTVTIVDTDDSREGTYAAVAEDAVSFIYAPL